MSNPPAPSEDPLAGVSREELMSALFANMVVQQTNMAMMLLGHVPHPETGQLIQDLETARTFIEQLEMLREKTKGNLNKQEEGLLKQALGALQLAFVEAVDAPAAARPSPAEPGHVAPTAPAAPPPAEPARPAAAAPSAEAPPAPDESRKKFSKKY